MAPRGHCVICLYPMFLCSHSVTFLESLPKCACIATCFAQWHRPATRPVHQHISTLELCSSASSLLSHSKELHSGWQALVTWAADMPCDGCAGIQPMMLLGGPGGGMQMPAMAQQQQQATAQGPGSPLKKASPPKQQQQQQHAPQAATAWGPVNGHQMPLLTQVLDAL